MKSWWRSLSVSKKLYAVVGIMGVLIVSELGTLYFAMTTLSAVRAFVGGEGLWTKAQKNFVSNLHRYAETGNDEFYRVAMRRLEVPLGDRRARLELEKPVYDMNLVMAGFVAGGNHPDDIPPVARLVRRFQGVGRVQEVFDIWRRGDTFIDHLITLAGALREAVVDQDMERVTRIQREITREDRELSDLEAEFSRSIGEVSRWLERLLLFALIAAVVLIEGTGLLLTVSFGRGLKRVLSELAQAARRVEGSDFTGRVPVRSDDELGDLATAINRMTESLAKKSDALSNAEHASEVKNLFLANMSHEIRTPLNAILGFAELLSEPDLTPARRRRYFETIRRTGASLTAIINDVLDLAKIEAEKLQIESAVFALDQLIADLSSLLGDRAAEKGLALKFIRSGELSAAVMSDPSRLRQVLVNLIGNAIKFTESGEVVVTYRAVDDALEFEIADTGIGIAPALVPRLFKPFSQGDDSTRKRFGGTGLGLLLSRRLTRLLGGDVELVRNVPGEGTTFVARVAYVPASLERVPNEVPPAHALTGRHVLVVEDSADNRELAGLFLEAAGAAVSFAVNGLEGVRAALERRPDVLLMDMQMPVMDGFTATRELRAGGFTAPIVALTGYAMKGDRENCLRAGCDDYLTKPFTRANLVRGLVRAMRPRVPGPEVTAGI